MTHPFRIVLTGHYAPITAVVDRFVAAHEFSLVKIPSIGDCLQQGTRPELWHSAMAAFLVAHPGHIVFVGGLSADHDWLCDRGAYALHVTDRLGFEVIADRRSADSPRWTDYSAIGIDQKVVSALGIVHRIRSGNTSLPALKTGT